MNLQTPIKGTLYVAFPASLNPDLIKDQLNTLDDAICNNEDATIQDLIESNIAPEAKFFIKNPALESDPALSVHKIEVSILVWIGIPKIFSKDGVNNILAELEKWPSKHFGASPITDPVQHLRNDPQFKDYLFFAEKPDEESPTHNFFEVELI